jgi:hypothetical protein
MICFQFFSVFVLAVVLIGKELFSALVCVGMAVLKFDLWLIVIIIFVYLY